VVVAVGRWSLNLPAELLPICSDRLFRLWRPGCGISSKGQFIISNRHGIGVVMPTLYSAKASSHELSSAESSQISSCDIPSPTMLSACEKKRKKNYNSIVLLIGGWV
jgi:hypothetical protein